HATLPLLQATEFPAIHRASLTTLQVNLGYKCNQTCQHCHVDAGPNRTEMMDDANIELVLQVLEAQEVQTLDLTGGAPELHQRFRDLVKGARDLGVHVINRCNLTILFEPGQEDLAQFLAEHRVEVVASMPCYSLENVDRQRGKGTFDKSIAGLQALNALGYGKPAAAGEGLLLNLVYNPQGPSLPPEQGQLQADYKRELLQHFGIVFNELYTLANMPIKRFGSMLISKGQFNSYMQLLKDSYQAENLEGVMCRSQISVDWQGYLYDCDFNQQLGMDLQPGDTPRMAGRSHLREMLRTDPRGQRIRVGDHCYGCTAGQGSSCGGALHG
ncbi:MAG: arsenosugar biosynthesis radical SAM (seleno)protein ArsS, partial [Giesbergeria sp.]